MAVRLVTEGGGYPDSLILAGIAAAVPAGGWPGDDQVRQAFTPAGRGLVPPEFHGVLDALS